MATTSCSLVPLPAIRETITSSHPAVSRALTASSAPRLVTSKAVSKVITKMEGHSADFLLLSGVFLHIVFSTTRFFERAIKTHLLLPHLFIEPQSAICGNGVVEAGEECDCGWEEDCQEKCCFPMRSIQLPGERPCTLRPSTTCSPSQVDFTEPIHLRLNVICFTQYRHQSINYYTGPVLHGILPAEIRRQMS